MKKLMLSVCFAVSSICMAEPVTKTINKSFDSDGNLTVTEIENGKVVSTKSMSKSEILTVRTRWEELTNKGTWSDDEQAEKKKLEEMLDWSTSYRDRDCIDEGLRGSFCKSSWNKTCTQASTTWCY